MPVFEVTSPDGAKYQVTAPEGASEADVLAKVRESGEHAEPKMSRLERFAAGFMDPIFGAAQIGARMGPEPGDIYSEDDDREKRKEIIDKYVKEREKRLEASADGGFDWYRFG